MKTQSNLKLTSRNAAAIIRGPPNSDTKPNWIPLPDPVTEDQVKLKLTWRAGTRTRASL